MAFTGESADDCRCPGVSGMWVKLSLLWTSHMSSFNYQYYPTFVEPAGRPQRLMVLEVQTAVEKN
jgi:hypothetical protein